MAKIILVKSGTNDAVPCQLLPASADSYDDTTEMVHLAEPIMIDNVPVLIVPKALCFEFDANAMAMVNALVVNALDKSEAARQIIRNELVPVTFQFGSPKVKDLISH